VPREFSAELPKGATNMIALQSFEASTNRRAGANGG
jgi:hypothetical protein